MINLSKYIKGRVICPLFVIVALSSCVEKQEWSSMNGEALGTTYHIQFLDEGERSFSESDMDSIMKSLNHSLSTYQKNSLITAFNTNDASIWQNPEEMKFFGSDLDHFMTMVNLSKAILEPSYGAFDPTAAPLFDLYDRSKNEVDVFTDEAILEVRSHMGFDKLGTDPNGLPHKKDSLLQLNFNAIAKGYAVDIVSVHMESLGIKNYLVEIGGEVRVRGTNPEGKKWVLGVNRPDPSAALTEIFEAIELDSGAMATSGNYRNFYRINDSLIGHTIDPRTGHPVVNSLKSATVFYRYCAVADAFATACMVLGPDSAKMMIERDSNLSAYFIVQEKDTLRGYFVNRP